MTTTQKPFEKASEVKKFIATLTDGYASILDNCLIESDGKISISHWMSIDMSCKKCKIPYKFFIGVRTRGVESAENHEHIDRRIEIFGDKIVCDIEIHYLASIKKYIVTYTRSI